MVVISLVSVWFWFVIFLKVASLVSLVCMCVWSDEQPRAVTVWQTNLSVDLLRFTVPVRQKTGGGGGSTP